MKNEHIKPGDVVPAEIRIQVYEEALRIIEKGERRYWLRENTLCLLLPCILWSLECFLDISPCGNKWFHTHTSTMFPELTDEVIEQITYEHEPTAKNELRIEFLRSAILSLTP